MWIALEKPPVTEKSVASFMDQREYKKTKNPKVSFIIIISPPSKMKQKIILLFIFFLIRYSPPLTNLATQTEFSQPQKDCSGSSKDGHGLKYEWWIVELI